MSAQQFWVNVYAGFPTETGNRCESRDEAIWFSRWCRTRTLYRIHVRLKGAA